MFVELRTTGQVAESQQRPQPSPAGLPSRLDDAALDGGSWPSSTDHALGAPRNLLLGGLSPAELAGLSHHLESVSLKRGQRIHRPGSPVEHVYFPESCIFALSIDGRDEVELVGHEGFLGLEVALSEPAAAAHAVVRVPGRALRVNAHEFRRALGEVPSLRAVVNRRIYATLLTFARTASCTRMHALRGRLAGLLVRLHRAAGEDRLPLTHEEFARLLGITRRATITEALRDLRENGLVALHRRGVTIVDVAGLSRSACSCHGDPGEQAGIA